MFAALTRYHTFVLLKDTHYCKAFVYGWGAPGRRPRSTTTRRCSRASWPRSWRTGVLYEEVPSVPSQGAEGTPKPRTFGAAEVTAELVRKMKEASCSWNRNSTKPCFLFARQFGAECLGAPAGAGERAPRERRCYVRGLSTITVLLLFMQYCTSVPY